MAENGLLDPGIASAIERTNGVKQEGVRAGTWLLKDQATELLNAPDPSTLKGKRDRAILALLISSGLRRTELVGLSRPQREGRWLIPDLCGKRKPTPHRGGKGANRRVDPNREIHEGKIFRPVNKGSRVTGNSSPTRKPSGRWSSITLALARETRAPRPAALCRIQEYAE
jgi:hypothetical protein